MKQSHVLVAWVDTFNLSGRDPDEVGRKLEELIQYRLNDGWTLRAAPSSNGIAWLVFVRKEVKKDL